MISSKKKNTSLTSIVVLLSNSDCLYSPVVANPLDQEEQSKDFNLNDYMQPNEELLEGQIALWLSKTDETYK